MTTRLVLDELDLDLAPLAARLVVVVVIVVGGSGAGALALDAAIFGIAVVEVVGVVVWVGGIVINQLGGHDGWKEMSAPFGIVDYLFEVRQPRL